MTQHIGNTITDLQELVERYAAKKAVDEMGDKDESLVVLNERARRIVADVTKAPSGGEWFRFVNEDRPDEPDYDDLEFEQ